MMRNLQLLTIVSIFIMIVGCQPVIENNQTTSLTTGALLPTDQELTPTDITTFVFDKSTPLESAQPTLSVKRDLPSIELEQTPSKVSVEIATVTPIHKNTPSYIVSPTGSLRGQIIVSDVFTRAGELMSLADYDLQMMVHSPIILPDINTDEITQISASPNSQFLALSVEKDQWKYVYLLSSNKLSEPQLVWESERYRDFTILLQWLPNSQSLELVLTEDRESILGDPPLLIQSYLLNVQSGSVTDWNKTCTEVWATIENDIKLRCFSKENELNAVNINWAGDSDWDDLDDGTLIGMKTEYSSADWVWHGPQQILLPIGNLNTDSSAASLYYYDLRSTFSEMLLAKTSTVFSNLNISSSGQYSAFDEFGNVQIVENKTGNILWLLTSVIEQPPISSYSAWALNVDALLILTKTQEGKTQLLMVNMEDGVVQSSLSDMPIGTILMWKMGAP